MPRRRDLLSCKNIRTVFGECFRKLLAFCACVCVCACVRRRALLICVECVGTSVQSFVSAFGNCSHSVCVRARDIRRYCDLQRCFSFGDCVRERQDVIHVRHLKTLLQCRVTYILVAWRSAFNTWQGIAVRLTIIGTRTALSFLL